MPAGSLLRKKHRGSRVSVLRSRLIISGDLDKIDNRESAVFDGELEKAVKRFVSLKGSKPLPVNEDRQVRRAIVPPSISHRPGRRRDG